MDELAIKIEHVSKEYRLGAIGGGTLRGDLQTWWARKRGKEDPNAKVGARTDVKVGERFLALDDINIEVKKGEALGIIGHNGAGKSTLLKLLSRVTAPTSGTISYNGRIASMLEVGTGFHPELTGRENVYMNGAILGMSKAEIDRKFDQIVEFAEMRRFIDTPVKRYSSGMYVKLAFAVAAHLDSEIMVMDEVLAVGDMKFQQKCLGKMGDAANNDGRTVLYVSHNMSTIRQLCSRCVVLDHGKVIFDGDTETAIDIYADSQQKMDYHYDFSEQPRSVLKNRKLEFVSMDVMADPSAAIAAGDHVKLKLLCRANESFANMFLRFEIVAADNTVAGTMFEKTPLAANAGQELELVLDVDTEHLVPGKYRFDLLAFEQNEFGNQDWCDRVSGAPVLELRKKDDRDLDWLAQWWGHTRFTDFNVDSIHLFK
ncbi:MAG: ATP-binding cassette domain-containing protein [Clostridia bacterium]|nr:ATP-binding cassette domain-containing protein [Clostridia bacterium]